MSEIKYRRVDLDSEPCQFVGVYVLKWRPEWGEPSVGFAGIESETPEEQGTLGARVAELEAERDAARVAALEYVESWTDACDMSKPRKRGEMVTANRRVEKAWDRLKELAAMVAETEQA